MYAIVILYAIVIFEIGASPCYNNIIGIVVTGKITDKSRKGV